VLFSKYMRVTRIEVLAFEIWETNILKRKFPKNLFQDFRKMRRNVKKISIKLILDYFDIFVKFFAACFDFTFQYDIKG